jgi:poly(3-hydroxybutyrate) depolymerase
VPVRIAGVAALLLVVGCGRIGFDDLRFDDLLTARLVAGSSTADLELCGRQSTYWVTTAPVLGEWGPETLDDRVAALPVLHTGRTAPGAPCTMISNLLIGPEQVAIYAYAVTDERDKVVEATATMMPTWTREVTEGGVVVWVHRPEQMYRDPSVAMPALVFLHGWGHATNVNDSGRGVATMPRDSGFLELFGQDIAGANPARTPSLVGQPFIVLAPHCVHGGSLGDAQIDCWGWASADRLYDETMQYARARFPIDDARIYATGTSTGGEGTFRLASMRPLEIAAAVPVASTYSSAQWFSARLCDAVDVPIWAFHSRRDTSNPSTLYTNSEQLVATLNGCGPDQPARLDLGDWMSADGNGHSGWLEVYGDTHGKAYDAFTSIYPWLLAHSR